MLADVIIRVDESGTIHALEWRSEALRQAWLVHEKKPDDQVLASLVLKKRGILTWNDTKYLFDSLEARAGDTILLLKQDDRSLEIIKKSLDFLEDGIQIYDADTSLIYMNSVSKKLSGFTDANDPLEGQKLMDLYHVTDESSTVLTTMRMRRPVFNRFARFLSASGKTMITCNTGYPLYDSEKNFLGAVVFEQDVQVLQKKKERQEKIRLAMDQEITAGLYAKDPSAYTFDDFIGKNPKVQEAIRLAQSVAAKESNILLLGETGTGKEIFAQSIHHDSLRSKKKFVALNCAAIPEQLIESSLFGTEKGSFTGSLEKKGLFEEADGGTLYLDELNSMSLSMQSKLLRVLQEGAFRRVGGNREIHTNVRIIASCNEEVFQLIQENKLRQDLFYRIATIMIQLPPLREHPDDLEDLIRYRIQHSKIQGVPAFKTIDPQVIWTLQQYNWPGNVRELNHVVDYAMTVSEEDTLTMSDLPAYLLNAMHESTPMYPAENDSAPALLRDTAPAIWGTLQHMLQEYEEQILRQALRQTKGNISQAAKLLGIKRQNLQYRLRKANQNRGSASTETVN